MSIAEEEARQVERKARKERGEAAAGPVARIRIAGEPAGVEPARDHASSELVPEDDLADLVRLRDEDDVVSALRDLDAEDRLGDLLEGGQSAASVNRSGHQNGST